MCSVISTLKSKIESCSKTIQVKVIWHFPVVLFIMLYKVVLTFKSVMKSPSVNNQMQVNSAVYYVDEKLKSQLLKTTD